MTTSNTDLPNDNRLPIEKMMNKLLSTMERANYSDLHTTAIAGGQGGLRKAVRMLMDWVRDLLGRSGPSTPREGFSLVPVAIHRSGRLQALDRFRRR